ncbi:MAG: rRNA pseudouridine synthase [Bacteroidales bacterium]|jgi:23S rRNA pseudouridine2605 synthase|nr:rRNA pseudouridine synthase [Bacteroidales bacterium]
MMKQEYKGNKGKTRSGNKVQSAKYKVQSEGHKVQSGRGNKTHSSSGVEIRLNKYIANAGICSRREADVLITSGAVRINGEIVTQLGTKVMPDDRVEFGGETLAKEKKVYVLMNKPRGYITTTDDPKERKTVMDLLANAVKERIYPVGRLDRNTTGVLLLTNDGDLAKRLTHPSHGARKIYHVTLDKNVIKADLLAIARGVDLEDGHIDIDEIDYIEGTKKEIGIQIHCGMNRVVRRIFEKFNYQVIKLDRVLFAELTKKNLSKGEFRILTEKEVSFLKMNAKK